MKDLEKAIGDIQSELAKILPNLDLRVVDYTINPIIRVDAKLASELLTKNQHNRKLNANRVAFYQKEMAQNNWKINGETIKFDSSGKLLDGQHRLNALSKLENKSVNIELRLDINPNEFATLDTGKTRSFADVLSVLQAKNYTIVACAIKYLYMYQNKKMHVLSGSRGTVMNNGNVIKGKCTVYPGHSGSNAPSNNELEKLYYDNLNINNFVVQHKLLKTIAPSSEITFLYYIFAKIDYDLAGSFITKLVEGNNLEPDETICVLRTILQQNSIKNGVKFSVKKRLGLVITAWNLIRRGKYKIKKIKFDELLEPFPYAM